MRKRSEALALDGEAVEAKREKAEVEREKARDQFLRGKAWLGRELLTWLLWRSESSEALFDDVSVLLADKLVLKGIDGDIVDCTVKGAMAPYAPLVREALDRGLLVHQARLRLARGERTYEVTVDAEFFDLKSGKLPESTADEDDAALLERLENAEELGALIEQIQEQFLKLRTSRAWEREVVPQLKAWMRAP